LEEASVFCPEGELAPSSEILKSVSTQGRGYGFLLISIFQRSSLTSKNVLSQTHNWFIGKTMNPIDRQAILRSAEKIEVEHDKVIKNLMLATTVNVPPVNAHKVGFVYQAWAPTPPTIDGTIGATEWDKAMILR